MKLGAISYCFKNTTALKDVIAIYKAIGFSYVELASCNADYKRLDPAAAAPIVRQISEAGLELLVYAAGGLRNDPQDIEKLFSFAQALGVKMVTGSVHRDAIPAIDRICVEKGMRFAIENHRNSQFESPQQVAEALAASSNRIGSNIDSGHFAYLGHDPVAAVDLFAGRIYHVHLKDARDGKMCVAGEGEVNLVGFLDKLKAANYQGMLSIEYEAGPASEAGVRKYKAFYDRYLQKQV